MGASLISRLVVPRKMTAFSILMAYNGIVMSVRKQWMNKSGTVISKLSLSRQDTNEMLFRVSACRSLCRTGRGKLSPCRKFDTNIESPLMGELVRR